MCGVIIHHPGCLERIIVDNSLPQFSGSIIFTYTYAPFNQRRVYTRILLRERNDQLLKLVGYLPKIVAEKLREEARCISVGHYPPVSQVPVNPSGYQVFRHLIRFKVPSFLKKRLIERFSLVKILVLVCNDQDS